MVVAVVAAEVVVVVVVVVVVEEEVLVAVAVVIVGRGTAEVEVVRAWSYSTRSGSIFLASQLYLYYTAVLLSLYKGTVC